MISEGVISVGVILEEELSAAFLIYLKVKCIFENYVNTCLPYVRCIFYFLNKP